MAGLNQSQADAVSTLTGPLLVLAGAGTGKTRVVTHRIAKLIATGTPADRILAVTFTNKAAGEMRERAAALLPRRATARPTVTTFHSLCVQLLRRHITRIGYPARFVIFDRGEQERVAREVLRQAKIATAALRPGDLLWHISQWKTQGLLPVGASQSATDDREHLAAVAYRRYQKTLELTGGVDFDDLLLLSQQLLEQFDEVRQDESGRYDHILIDEYQDTNDSQYRIVRTLANRHRNLCVVGDDDQAIYGWRGAEVRHILRFRVDWPEAKVVRLQENYRSTAEILKVANRLIRHNTQRHEKQLIAARPGGERPRIVDYKDEVEEATEVVRLIRWQIERGSDPSDIAILFRTNEQPRLFEDALRTARIPYMLLGSRSFYDRKEVRDVLAFVRAVTRPQDDIALLRIMNVPPRGISNRTVAALRKEATAQGVSIAKLAQSPHGTPGVAATAADAVQQFTKRLAHLRGRARTTSPSEFVHEMLREVRYDDELTRLYEDPTQLAARQASVGEIINSAAKFESDQKKATLFGWMDELALSASEFESSKESKLRGNSVVLMTLHAAKGLEFPHVFMVGMEEGLLPHKNSVLDEKIDEERRLCYVGVTRAQETLLLSLARTRRKWGKPRESIPSRFLYELIGKSPQPTKPATPHQQSARRRAGSRKEQ